MKRGREPRIVIDHRAAVGGAWVEMGWWQLGYMVGAGLRPTHNLLDVGCGSLRGGRLFVGYLEPGRYWGFDKVEALLDAGWWELGKAGMGGRKAHLYVVKDFDLSRLPDDLRFEYALAQSVFTHLLPDQILGCLRAVVPRLERFGQFHATFFSGGQAARPGKPHAFREGERDIVSYPFSVFEKLADGAGARVQLVGKVGHPRGQQMMMFTRKPVQSRGC